MELTYTIKRLSRRRTLTITVERDRRVVVHAPESTSEEKILPRAKKFATDLGVTFDNVRISEYARCSIVSEDWADTVRQIPHFRVPLHCAGL